MLHLLWSVDTVASIEKLAVKKMPSDLKETLNEVIKIEFWAGCIKKNQTECLPNCHTFLKDNLQEYFPKQSDPLTWLRNSFMDEDNGMKQNLSVTEKEQLTDISTDLTLKTKYKDSLLPFWINLLHEYPELSKRALKHFMAFATTNMCEAAFSIYVATKNKYRSKLDAAPDMRLQLTNIVPDLMVFVARSKLTHHIKKSSPDLYIYGFPKGAFENRDSTSKLAIIKPES
ncbi:zinc finger BED domain-containing protein 5-like [Macrobrachium nipponense]|uniref:zinc finger BED domain-containing protein 5-like n=1 Tax=Macrobrachium nipponense TaxID=159736 RepID=UPI0030C822F5